MDLGNIFQSVVAWVTGCPAAQVGVYVLGFLLVDLVLGVLLGKIFEYFCGREVAERVEKIALPAIAVLLGIGCIADAVWRFVRAPWEYRRRRLIREYFGIDATTPPEDIQRRVDRKLGYLARCLRYARQRGESVKYYEREFRAAYNLAKTMRMRVRRDYTDYLNCW